MGKTKIKEIEIEVSKEPKLTEAAADDAERGVTGTGDPRRVPAASVASEDIGRGQSPAGPRAKKTSKKPRRGVPKYRSKKHKEAAAQVEPAQKYPLKEAVELAQKASYSKFKGTIEAHLNTSAKNLRGLVTLPHMAGKQLTVLAFGKGAEEAGADVVGTEETIAEIEKGKISFDVLVTTPEWMPKLARIARVLGPKGLMPNPKSGTITDNLAKTVAELKAGKTEYRTEPNGQVVHLPIGKVDQPTEEIAANIKVLYNIIGKSRIKKITLSPTMGPGVKVDLGTI